MQTLEDIIIIVGCWQADPVTFNPDCVEQATEHTLVGFCEGWPTSGGRRICVCQNKRLTIFASNYVLTLRNKVRSPVGVDKRVAVTLWRLATTNIEYRT